MAKKIVRGITDVKTITNQDFDTNNVNDLLSDGQYNYIHRKKGKNEEYHNLTDNIKTISSDNTELLSVTNNNKTTNTATLHPKHDKQKEQVLESTRNTITINHGENGTDEKTAVDVNFDKVQAKLTTGDGLSISNNKISIKPALNGDPLNNGFYMGNLINDNSSSSIISLQSDSDRIVQLSFRESAVTPSLMIMRYRFVNNNVATDWKLTTIDNEQLLTLLARKEQVLESTRNTITINRGERTKVDTNPQKVLEHENLISDSEYITLSHQTDENTTHIQTAALEQELQQIIEFLGTIHIPTINYFSSPDFHAVQLTVSSRNKAVVTFSFECTNAAETVITGALKQQLGLYVLPNTSISNSAITISNDGTTMKLINSSPSENVKQHATFTFYYFYDEPGGGGVPGGDAD